MTAALTTSRVGVSLVMRSLTNYTLRLTRWPMLACGIAGSWLLVWWRAGDVTTPDGAVWLVRGITVLLGVTVVFAFDDPSVDTTRSLSASRGVLMRLRFGVGGLVAVMALAPVVLATWGYLSRRSTVMGLLLEMCVLLVLTASAALVMQRRFGISEPGQFVVLVVVGLLMVAQLFGQRWPLLVPPGPQWTVAHWRWVGILVAGLLVLACQLRDPASRRLGRPRR